MKILIVGDLHGRKPVIKFKDFDAIIMVGDVCDDRELAPLYRKFFRFVKDNPNAGIGMDEFFIRQVGKRKLREMERNSLKKGNEILKFLDKLGKPIFFTPGNYDQSYGKTRIKNMEKSDYSYLKAFYDFWLGEKLNPKLIKGVKNLKSIQYKNRVFKEVNIIGYGLVSAPEKIQFRESARRDSKNYSEKERAKLELTLIKIKEKLKDAYVKRNKNFPTIFVSHNIPYNTKLDKIKDRKSVVFGRHFGSWVVRDFCARYQPIICIGGHIHEGKGKDKIGKTLVINPGYGKDAQVLLEIKGKKVKVKFLG